MKFRRNTRHMALAGRERVSYALRQDVEQRAQLSVAEANALAGQQDGTLREDVESRAQLAVAEANALAEQQDGTLREDVESRAQLAVAEANALAEQQDGTLREDVESRAQLAVAETNALAEQQDGTLREDVESRAQLAVAEANALAEQQDGTLRQDIESRAQRAVAEANALAAQQACGLRQDVEHRAQLALAEGNAITEQQHQKLREEIEFRSQLAMAELEAHLDERDRLWRVEIDRDRQRALAEGTACADKHAEMSRTEVERRVQLAVAEMYSYVDARIAAAAGIRPTGVGPRAASIWSPPLKWSVEGNPDDQAATRNEIARALTELGHVVTQASPDDATAVTVLVAASKPTPIHAAGPILMVGYDWEEGGYPLTWIDEINDGFAGVACASTHAEKILVDHGARVALAATGLGVDQWERVAADRDYRAPGKRFRFLHVSSCSPAKGLDLLLESFGRVFDAGDDVSLIIKPFGKVPNELVKQLDGLRGANSDFPNVILIDDMVSEAELKALYGQCHVFVAPSRAEGFALPIANALLSGLPVVATAWGGHLDYCNKTNSWLVDFQFQPSRSQHGLVSSIWAEPVAKALDEALWQAYRAEPATSFSKAWSGRKFLMDHYTWKDVALRVAALANEVKAPPVESASATRVGFVTTWNARCGIATYSRHLLQAIEPDEYVIFAAKQAALMGPDERNCIRVWQQGIRVNGLTEIIQYIPICSVEALVIQFTYGFFNRRELGDFVDAALAQGIVVLVEFHSTKDPHKDILDVQLADFVDTFRKCHRLLAHGPADLNRLKAVGLLEKATIFPHGVLSRRRQPPHRAKRNGPPLIISFGFCLPNKGLPELVQATGILKRAGSPIRLRMLNAEFPDPVSGREARKIRTMIEELGLQNDVEFQTDFLDDDACLDLLAEADLLVNSYQKTDESASGAVRYGLAARCPVAVTPLAIFDDLGESVFRLPGTAPEQMAQGIAAVLRHLQEKTETAVHVRHAALCWLEEHDIGRQGIRLMHTARALARLQPALA